MDSPGARGLSRKPFGELTNNFDEALTPTANLKLLTRVASETDQLPSKRELFRDDGDLPADLSLKTGFKRDRDDWAAAAGQQENLTPSGLKMFGPPKVSRKEKSLGLLCENFIKRFPEAVPEGQKCEIPLDDLAKSMATERRRIYDIVNVLEAVQMMTKVGKNLYQWHGTTFRRATLIGLRELALNLKLVDRFNEVKVMEESDLSSLFSFTPPHASGTPKGFSPFTPNYSSPSSISSGPSPSPAERQTSLGVACQKFLMLFLITPEPNYKINLEFAAKVIHGPVLPEPVMKTRIRRLYDIANILQSLQLIRKVQVTDQVHGCKKPAFEYIGPNVEEIGKREEIFQTLPSTRQRNSLLGVGKNLTNIPDDEPRPQPTNPILHFKKRFNIGQHFNDDDASPEHQGDVQRENKIPRTHESPSAFPSMTRSASFEDDNSTPQNLTMKRSSECSNSLIDLSTSSKREYCQVSTSLSSSVSSFSSVSSSCSFNSFDWARSSSYHLTASNLKKKAPLQVSPLLSSNVRVMDFDPSGGSFSRWENFGYGHSKTVIALVSPHHPSGGAFYPAVQTSPVSLVMRKSILRD